MRVLNFGMICWEKYSESMEVGPDEIISVLKSNKSFRAMRTLVYSALKAQEYFDDKDEITEKQVAEWINDDFGIVQQIFAKATETLIEKQTAGSGEKKSRSRSTKSKK